MTDAWKMPDVADKRNCMFVVSDTVRLLPLAPDSHLACGKVSEQMQQGAVRPSSPATQQPESAAAAAAAAQQP